MYCDRELYTPQDTAMKALVIYDDLPIAAVAIAALQHAAYHLSAAMQWNLKPWRIDMLKFLPAADEALSDGADAHLIVIAVRRTPSLPAWLIDWLERWAALRHTPDAAVTIISDGNATVSLAQATVELSQFALRNGLNVICGDCHETDSRPAFLHGNSIDRKSYVHSTPPRFGQAPNHGAHHAWGINE
jgi:hypothetical protein